MKKAVVASLLAFFAATGIGCGGNVAFAQTQVNLGSQSSGDVQLSPGEYADYTAAMGQTDPKAKAAAIEAYLTKYPQSQVKTSALQTLMLGYSTFDAAKTLDTADRLLQVDPTNLAALTYEVLVRKSNADSLTDPAAKQAALDAAAGYAQKGFTAPKPKDMNDADFAKMKQSATPVFYSAIGSAALNKKDTATAIDNFKKELASVPVAQTQTPGMELQDTYALGSAYYQSTPPDLLNCAFYAARAANFAPEPYKTQMMPLAKYCYKKFHGGDDGFDAVTTAAAANLNPPAEFAASIKPAPTPADIVNQVMASTQDLSTLAISDREFILENGTPDQIAKVWDTMKGKSVEIPGAVVMAATPTSLQAAVSEDAVQGKTADFTFNLKAPEEGKKLTRLEEAEQKKKDDAIAAATTVGSTVTITGTYDSYTTKPFMITMAGSEVVLPKATTVKKPTPARRATTPARKK